MAGFRVSSGGLDKNINRSNPKEAAYEALKQWGICGKCKLGLVTQVYEGEDEPSWFLTAPLLDKLRLSYTVVGRDVVLTNCEG